MRIGKASPYLLITLLGLVVYARTISFDFTYLDDGRLIVENRQFLKNPSNIITAFRQDVLAGPSGAGIYYRPLLTLSFMLDAQLGGASAAIYHLTNIILHLLASCLVFLFFKKIGYREDLALSFSLIFAIHPVLTQAVAWIPGRNDVLLAIFVLLSSISILNSGYFRHIFFLLAALFTKESAVFLPLVCFIYLHLVKREKPFSARANYLALGWLGCVIFWIIVRKIALPNPAAINMFSVAGHVAQNLPAIIQLVGKIVFPVNLSVLPIMEDTTFLYGFLAIALVTAAFLFSKNIRYNFLAFGISWFVFFLLPTFVRLDPSAAVDLMEHRLYLPIIGFMIIILETGFVKKLDIAKTRWQQVSVALCVAVFCIITFRYSDNFKDRTVFWQGAARTSPHSIVSHTNLGCVYLSDGLFDKAVPEFKKVIAMAPGRAFGYNYLGSCYMEKGMFKEAEAEFRKSLAIDPLSGDVGHNLANAYFKQGKLKEAGLLLRK